MPNERTTEEIVRSHLREHGVRGQLVEEQTSADPMVRRALASASKAGVGAGHPEFIVTFPDQPSLVIVFECKADRGKHESAHRDDPVHYAVDGVLVYARVLARRFDVIAVAVSGTRSEDLAVTTFRQLRGSPEAELLPAQRGGTVDQLEDVATYRRLLTFDPAMVARTQAELIAFSRVLHNYMRDYAKLSESEKPLIVSGILLALRDDTFKMNWRSYKPRYLAGELYAAIERVARDADLEEDKREAMMAPHAFVKTHPELSRDASNEPGPLYKLVADIDEHVRPFLDTYDDVDVIGQFYGEFLRYTGGDKKGLGIVLTPRHLTELFVKIADVKITDVVLDTCAGTGGFLIAAMAEMDRRAHADEERRQIRKNRLIGIEQQPHMFALAVSNMILRGDGKANMLRGSCFDEATIEKLREGVDEKHRGAPTVGLINPPFSQKGEGQHELEFVEALLEQLTPGGRAVVVVPMSCAIEQHPARRRLLEKHTLVAQMSLPNDLFHPVGVITCAMVFRAHEPHAEAVAPTWFGYWKDDGFVKTKDRGRIDLNQRWEAIRDTWLADFHARRVNPGNSVMRKVGPTDEWCVEAYMETDYSTLSVKDFEDSVREYAVFSVLHAGGRDAGEETDAHGI